MSTTVSFSSNYRGEVAGEILGKAFKEVSTIKNGLVNVLPNISSKISLRKIDYGNGRQDYACGFTPTGSTSLSEVTLEPKKIKNENEICKEDFRILWDQAKMGFSAHNDNYERLDEATALIAEILADTAVAVDSDIWVGTDTDGHFKGLIPTLVSAGGFVSVTGTTVSESNVIAEMQKFVKAIPVALRKKSDLILGVSSNVAVAFENYQVSQGYAYGVGGAEGKMKWGSYTITEINSLADNTMIAYQVKNFNFGTGLLADHNEVRVKDMDESDLSGNVRYKMVYTGGVAIVRPSEVVYYRTV